MPNLLADEGWLLCRNYSIHELSSYDGKVWVMEIAVQIFVLYTMPTEKEVDNSACATSSHKHTNPFTILSLEEQVVETT